MCSCNPLKSQELAPPTPSCGRSVVSILPPPNVTLEKSEFGLICDQVNLFKTPITKFTWTNSHQVSVSVINYGATIVEMKFPDKNGTLDDIVLGFDDLKGYLEANNPYFGATIGRNANRIGNARVVINGKCYKLTANLDKHQLHGGFEGFDKVIWECFVDGPKVVMTYLSKDKEEGFPGTIIASASFELTACNEFLIQYQACTTKPTCINLTTHSYFNLAGHDTGSRELYNHVLTVNADHITETTSDTISTGRLLPVDDTPFDLRIPKMLGRILDKNCGFDGFDHNFCINKHPDQEESFIACLKHPPSGRILHIYSNQPGLQVYTSNGFPDKKKCRDVNPKDLLIGKDCAKYHKHGAIALETQNFPNAINLPRFPNAVLNPGEVYWHTIKYKFSVKK